MASLSFAEQMALDAQACLDPDEFGKEFLFDGLEAVGVWELLSQQDGKEVGYSVERRLYFVYFPDGEPPSLPVVDQDIDIDGLIWTVSEAADYSGVFEVEVWRNVS